jgi:hypothetical protein
MPRVFVSSARTENFTHPGRRAATVTGRVSNENQYRCRYWFSSNARGAAGWQLAELARLQEGNAGAAA